MDVLNFTERAFVRLMFYDRMTDIYGSAFEDFFHRLMTLRYPDFVQVRTHGNIGDLSADGLRLHDGRLYACYAPEVFDTENARKVQAKFDGDLSGALAKRGGEFKTFVFVHNDKPGLHPHVTKLLAQAARDHAPLLFEPVGRAHLLRELYRLVRHEIEDLLGTRIMVEDLVYRVGLDELKPLLDHLVEHRRQASGQQRPREVSGRKMDYNRLGDDHREMLRRGMMHTHLIEGYYQSISDVTERDEVAAEFNAYYQQMAAIYDDPEDIICELQKYVAGNARGSAAQEQALAVVLAHFFETCDIFSEPPAGWDPASLQGSQA
ncbi:ABC-three component system protein [Catellatospora methionotrophica]|uniref:ABC-three component system protein n=1 Tax=Catellatospora methionotrophica TaxID=121620 RepID=UPI0033F50070